MSEHNDRGAMRYSNYDSMTTEQLQELLRWDSQQPDGEGLDTEELFYVLEVLTERRKSNSETAGKSVQEAWAEFQEHYMPREETTKSRIVFPVWMRRVTAAAAALVIFLAVTVSANAFGYDLWGKVADWSQEFFHFVDETQGTKPSEPDMDDETEYTSLQDALDRLNISEKLAPTWLPEGYMFSEVVISDTPREISIYTLYHNNDSYINVSIRRLIGSKPGEIEKSEDYLRAYDINGVTYYIFSNNKLLQAVWVVEEFECIISGEITIEEMKGILDSI